jgi:UDP-galactopyranose mutase
MRCLVVGAGITGASIASVLAEFGHEVAVYEKRDVIGGNCYDYYDENGICVHEYGTHIFHTDNAAVWDFLSRFTKWHPYMHRVKAFIDGKLVTIPFNLDSLHQVFPESLANRLESKLLEKYGFNKKVPILKLKETGDKDLEFLSDYIYEKVFLHYTLKQWGLTPEELNPAVTARVPVFVGRDDRYFHAKYQGIPLEGYTKMIERMLDHPNIALQLGREFKADDRKGFDHVFCTAPIDEYFGYYFGPLEYRSLKFDFQALNREYFQPLSVVNYPNNYDFTRIGEYKYFLDDISPRTVISYEYPQKFELGKNERFYPMMSDSARAQYEMYANLAKDEEKVTFIGRLAEYQYLDMDKSVESALKRVKAFVKP